MTETIYRHFYPLHRIQPAETLQARIKAAKRPPRPAYPSTIKPEQYTQSREVVLDLIDAVNRICDLNYPKGNPDGFRDSCIDLALQANSRIPSCSPLNHAINILTLTDAIVAQKTPVP